MNINNGLTVCSSFRHTLNQASFNKILKIIFKFYFKKSNNKYGFQDSENFCNYFLEIVNKIRTNQSIDNKDETYIKSLFMDKKLLEIFNRLTSKIKGKFDFENQKIFAYLFLDQHGKTTFTKFADYLNGLIQALSINDVYKQLNTEKLQENLTLKEDLSKAYGIQNIIIGKIYSLIQKNNNWFLLENSSGKLIGNTYDNIIITSAIYGCKSTEGIKITKIVKMPNDYLIGYDKIPYGGGNGNYFLLNEGGFNNTLFTQDAQKTEFKKPENILYSNDPAHNPFTSKEKCAVDLIHVPMNPIVKESMDFGKAEAVAGVLDFMTTFVIQLFTRNPLILSFAGPILEKVGFFGKEAIGARNDKRKGSISSFKEGFKDRFMNGLGNLIVDITVHDAIYASFMYYGLNNTNIHPAFLSLFSYLAALPPAAFAKHYGQIALYNGLMKYLKLNGYTIERYYESRFILTGDTNPNCIFEKLGKEFNLENFGKAHYTDTYIGHRIPSFCDRTPVLRVRQVDDHINPNESYKNIEAGFTLPKRRTPSRFSEYNYFFSAKDKAFKPVQNVEEEMLKILLAKGKLTQENEIQFTRQHLFDDELRLTLDVVKGFGKQDTNILELKTFNNLELLCDMMHHILCGEFSVKTTTQPKFCLIRKEAN